MRKKVCYNIFMTNNNNKTLTDIIGEIDDSNFKSTIIPRRALLVVKNVVEGVNKTIKDADVIYYTSINDDEILQQKTKEYILFVDILKLDLTNITENNPSIRGEIMDNVLVIELLVSQIFFVVSNRKETSKGQYSYENIQFFNTDFNSMWDKIDRRLDCGAKVKILQEMKIIKNRDEIHGIINVRNQLAHTLNYNFIYLNENAKRSDKKLLYSHLEEFKKWLEVSFEYLMDKYKEIWNPTDMAQQLLDEIKNKKQ